MEIGVIIVEVCESNQICNLDLDELQVRYPGVTVLQTECMSRCGLCEHNAYAFVNSSIVHAKDAETCFHRICKRIEYELSNYDDIN